MRDNIFFYKKLYCLCALNIVLLITIDLLINRKFNGTYSLKIFLSFLGLAIVGSLVHFIYEKYKNKS